uniref:DNA-directed DNA polymerase n=1 Tax=Parastrongyloides trichosuri TaxID=131310 RepID=A0A0N4ZZU0_PARTI
AGVRQRAGRAGRFAGARLPHADRRRRPERRGRLGRALAGGHGRLPAGRHPLVRGGAALRLAAAGRDLQDVAVAGFLHPPDAAPVPAHRRAGAAGLQVPAGCGGPVHRHGGADGHRLPSLPAVRPGGLPHLGRLGPAAGRPVPQRRQRRPGDPRHVRRDGPGRAGGGAGAVHPGALPAAQDPAAQPARHSAPVGGRTDAMAPGRPQRAGLRRAARGAARRTTHPGRDRRGPEGPPARAGRQGAGFRHRRLLRLPQRGIGRATGVAAAGRRLSQYLGPARRIRGLGRAQAARARARRIIPASARDLGGRPRQGERHAVVVLGRRRYRRLLRRSPGSGWRGRDLPGAPRARRADPRARPAHPEPAGRRHAAPQARHAADPAGQLRRGGAQLQGLRPGQLDRCHPPRSRCEHRRAAHHERRAAVRPAGPRVRTPPRAGRPVPDQRHARPRRRGGAPGQARQHRLRRTRGPGPQRALRGAGAGAGRGRVLQPPERRDLPGHLGKIRVPDHAGGRHLHDARLRGADRLHRRRPGHPAHAAAGIAGGGRRLRPRGSPRGRRIGAQDPHRSVPAHDRLDVPRPAPGPAGRGRPHRGRHAAPGPHPGR